MLQGRIFGRQVLACSPRTNGPQNDISFSTTLAYIHNLHLTRIQGNELVEITRRSCRNSSVYRATCKVLSETIHI